MPRGAEEEVDARVAVVGIGLLAGLGDADHLAVELDCEDEAVFVRTGLLEQIPLGQA
jgi:hypothetical protein